MPELTPFSSLLEEGEEEVKLTPFSSLLDEEYGLVPGADARRVPTAMDRGIDLPASAPVVEPLLGMQWAGKARDRLMLGFEGGQLDQEASNILAAGGAGIEDFLKRRKDFQRRSNAANVQGDNWFSQGFYGAMQMVGPMAEGGIQGAMYGVSLAGVAGAYGQAGPQVLTPEEFVTVPAAYAAGQMTGSMLYWQKQGEGALYADLMEQDVPHEVAAPIATAFSIPYAAIEYSQVSKVVPGFKRMVKQKIAAKVKSALKRHALQYPADIGSNVIQEVAQELTMMAGEAVAEVVSDADMEDTPFWERIGPTITETFKAMPFILAPGRTVKYARDVRHERKVKDFENFVESVGKEEAGRQPWSGEQVNQLIEAREELAGLKGHSGRVIMFSKITGTQESTEYIKIDKDADATSAIIAHEQANPKSVYRGVFDIGDTSIEVDGQVFDNEEQAMDAAAEAEAEGDQAKGERIMSAAVNAETIEGRMKVEAQYLGQGVLDPVRLGKHRIKARDIKQIFPGEVEDLRDDTGKDLGYRVTLANGFQLNIEFQPIADQREAKVESLISASQGTPNEITWKAWEALSKDEQDKILDGWHVAGSFVQAKTKTGEVIPDKFITAFGVTGDIGTFRHEAVHFLRKTGLINESEYDTLRKEFATPQLELETQISKLEDLGDKATDDDQKNLEALKEKLDNLQEEDVANGYAAFMHNPESKNSIFQKVYDFFNGILMVRSAAGLLRRIDKGELASRPKPVAPTEAAEPKLSVQARNERLVQATKDFEAGEITRAERNRVVAQEKPVVAPERLPVAEDIPTAAKLKKVLPEGKRRKVGKEPKEGETTEVRLDINTWVNKGVGVATHHVPREDSKGKTIKSVVGYAGVVALDGPIEFQVNEEKAAEIAKGEKPKHFMATVRGQFTKKFDLKEVDDTWTPVGIDPERHAYPYDKRQPSREITGGSRAIQIGTTVWTKDAEFRRPSEEKFSVQRKEVYEETQEESVKRRTESAIEFYSEPGRGEAEFPQSGEKAKRLKTLKEYEEGKHRDRFIESHRKAVANAVQNGWDVPMKVLQDYPESLIIQTARKVGEDPDYVPKFSVQPKLYSRLEEAINNMPQKAATAQEWIGRIKKLRERGTVKGIGMESPEGQSKEEIDWKMPALDALLAPSPDYLGPYYPGSKRPVNRRKVTYTKEEILALLRKRDVEVTMMGGRESGREPLEVETYWSDDFARSGDFSFNVLLEDLASLTPTTRQARPVPVGDDIALTGDDIEVKYIRDNTWYAGMVDEDGINPYYIVRFKNFDAYLAALVEKNQHSGWILSKLAPSVVDHYRKQFDQGNDTFAYISKEGVDNGFTTDEGGPLWLEGMNESTVVDAVEELVAAHHKTERDRIEPHEDETYYDEGYHAGSTLTGTATNGTRIALKVTPDERQEVPSRQGHFEADELGWSRVDERQLAGSNLDLKTKWKKFRDMWSVFINEIQSDWMQTAGRTVPTRKKEIEKYRKQITLDQREIDFLNKKLATAPGGPRKPSKLQADNLKVWAEKIAANQEIIKEQERVIREESGEAGFLTDKVKKAWSAIGQTLLTRTKEYVAEGIRPAIDALEEESRRLAAVINEKRESSGYEESLDKHRNHLVVASRSKRHGLLKALEAKMRDGGYVHSNLMASLEITGDDIFWNRDGTKEHIGTFVDQNMENWSNRVNLIAGALSTDRPMSREALTSQDIEDFHFIITMDDGTVLEARIALDDKSVINTNSLRRVINKEVANHLYDTSPGLERIDSETLDGIIDGWSGDPQDADLSPDHFEVEKRIAREILAATAFPWDPRTATAFQPGRSAIRFNQKTTEFSEDLIAKIKDKEGVLGYDAIDEMDGLVEATNSTILNLEHTLEKMGKAVDPDKLMLKTGTGLHNSAIRPEAAADYLKKIRGRIEEHRDKIAKQWEKLSAGPDPVLILADVDPLGPFLPRSSKLNLQAVERIENELSHLSGDMKEFSNLLKSVGQSGQFGIQPNTPLKGAWEQLVAMHVIEYAMARGIDRVSWPATVEQVFDIENWGNPKHTPKILNGRLNYDITLGKGRAGSAEHEASAWDESVKRGIPKTMGEYYKPIVDRYLKLGDRLAKRLKKYNPKIEKIPIAVTRKEDTSRYKGTAMYKLNTDAKKAFKSLPAKLKKFVNQKLGDPRYEGTANSLLAVLEYSIPVEQYAELTSALQPYDDKASNERGSVVFGQPADPNKPDTGMVDWSEITHPVEEVEDMVWSMEINDKMKKAAADGELTYKYSVQKRTPTAYQLDKKGSVQYPPHKKARMPRLNVGIASMPKVLLTQHEDDEWVKTVPQVTGSTDKLHLSAKAISNLDTILEKHPTPLADVNSWTSFYADVMASKEVPVAPEQLLEYINNPKQIVKALKQLTPKQITAAMNGLTGSLKIREEYRKGNATPVHTGNFLLWGILSRGISAFPHEAAFMDLVSNGVDEFIQKAVDGNYSAKDEAKFQKFVDKLLDNLNDSPGNMARRNINSFGAAKKTPKGVTRSLLYKFAEREPDGRTKLQAFHDILASDASGKEVRRAFHKLIRKPGIDNKVLSFVLLVTGRHDVVVMDRIQAGHLWDVKKNRDRFQTGNLYDGYGKVDGPANQRTGLMKLFEGPRGLAFYEAAERDLAKVLPQAFKGAGLKLPKGGKDYIGPFHWLSWVLSSNQVVGHDTLDAIGKDIKNVPAPFNNVAVTEGKMDRWISGVKYGIVNGQPVYILTTSKGEEVLTDRAGLEEYTGTLQAHGSSRSFDLSLNLEEEVNERGNEDRIVPHGIKPSKEAEIYGRSIVDHPRTDRLQLDRLIRRIGRQSPAETDAIRSTSRAGLPGPVKPKFSVQAATRIQEIEGYADPELEAETSQNDKDSVLAKVKGAIGRKSQQTVYFGNKKVLRDKQGLELDEAYQGRAVRIAVDNLWNKLVSDAWDSQAGFKLPKWFKVGKWAKRLKDFRKVALPLAAHLNAVNREAGQFTFADFNMRAGMMTEKEFKKKGYKPGDTITVKNELTGNLEELVIGGFIADQGRAGYQLERPVSAETQQELYDEFSERYPDLIWAVDTFIDPSLKNQRTTISGVEVPVFNRFSLEEFMKEGNVNFEGLPGYTPDVIVTRSMLGALKGVFNPKAGSRSPGRKYKTGTAREGAVTPGEDDVYTRRRIGGPMDLFEGFSVRAFQVLREKARKEYFKNIVKHATEPAPGGKPKPEYVTLQTGMGQVLDAIKAFQWFESPGKWVKTSLDAAEVATSEEIMVVEGVVYRFEKEFPETEDRLSKKGNPFGNYDKFLAEAYQMRGQERQIPKKLVDLLIQGYAADKSHGLMYRMGAWAIRNSTQSLLAHPFTYVVNALSNDAFTVEAMTKHGIAGLAKLPFDRPAAMEDLTYAKELLLAQFYKFHGIRKMLGWQTQFETFVEEVMPDDVFEGSTALADLKIQYHVGPMEYLKRGEVGAAALQAMQYGTIDIRAKQRLAYAFLKAKAVRAAKEKGLKGDALTNEIDSYMARPPKEDRLQAVELAQFEYLNYSDSPDALQRFAGNDYSRLLIPFPRFGYHWTAKQIQRVAAIKDVFGRKVPKGRRAEALADFVTFGLFTAGGVGFLLDSILSGGDDDDEIRERIGTARSLYYDENGELKSKALPRQLVTANRVNLSEYFRLLGIDDGDGEDFWWRVRQYPQISMAGALLMAWEDGKKVSEKNGAAAGLVAGVQTYAGQAKDMMSDFFTLGGGIKAFEKTARAMVERPGDRPQQMTFDPYATNVPFRFYVTDQAMTAFVPFRRQFDTVSVMLDPVMRRKTQSKTMDYYPGAWEAIQMGHATGLARRLLDSLNLMEVQPLMAQGTPKDIAYEPSEREKDETSRYRTEAMGILARKEPEARLFQNQAGNYRLGVIPQETRTTIRPGFQALNLTGFNVRPIPRNEYLKALQPPSQR